MYKQASCKTQVMLLLADQTVHISIGTASN